MHQLNNAVLISESIGKLNDCWNWLFNLIKLLSNMTFDFPKSFLHNSAKCCYHILILFNCVNYSDYLWLLDRNARKNPAYSKFTRTLKWPKNGLWGKHYIQLSQFSTSWANKTAFGKSGLILETVKIRKCDWEKHVACTKGCQCESLSICWLICGLKLMFACMVNLHMFTSDFSLETRPRKNFFAATGGTWCTFARSTRLAVDIHVLCKELK